MQGQKFAYSRCKISFRFISNSHSIVFALDVKMVLFRSQNTEMGSKKVLVKTIWPPKAFFFFLFLVNNV